MSDHEVTTNEIMAFLKDTVATKDDLHREVSVLKGELTDAIDDKLGGLKADLTILMRKEDRKVVGLIELLKGKKLISDSEAQKLLGMEPFPQT